MNQLALTELAAQSRPRAVAAHLYPEVALFKSSSRCHVQLSLPHLAPKLWVPGRVAADRTVRAVRTVVIDRTVAAGRRVPKEHGVWRAT